MNTYELTARWREIADLCVTMSEDDEGRIPGELLRLLSEIEGNLDEKLDHCCEIVRELDAQEAGLRAEAAWFQKKAQRAKAHSERISDFIKQQLTSMGWTSRKVSNRFTVSIQKSAPHVEITNINLIPHDFDKPREVRFSEIGKVLKDGKTVPGAELVSSNHLRIR